MRLPAQPVEFSAPWGRATRTTSPIAVVILIGSVVAALAFVRMSVAMQILLAATPILILLGAAAFMIQGYALEEDTLIIQRPGWTTRISLVNLRAATLNPKLMLRSLRIFGNGGLFAFNGLFWNRSLGRYRAYVTDLQKALVLTLADRTIVISPGSPEDFIAQLRARRLLPA